MTSPYLTLAARRCKLPISLSFDIGAWWLSDHRTDSEWPLETAPEARSAYLELVAEMEQRK